MPTELLNLQNLLMTATRSKQYEDMHSSAFIHFNQEQTQKVNFMVSLDDSLQLSNTSLQRRATHGHGHQVPGHLDLPCAAPDHHNPTTANDHGPGYYFS